MKKSSRKTIRRKLDKAWREFIYFRDNYTCQICGRTKTQGVINAHHIVTKGSSGIAGRYAVANGITLCFRCHQTDYIVLGDFCKEWLKKRGQDYYELRNEFAKARKKWSDDELEQMLESLEKPMRELKVTLSRQSSTSMTNTTGT